MYTCLNQCKYYLHTFFLFFLSTDSCDECSSHAEFEFSLDESCSGGVGNLSFDDPYYLFSDLHYN